MEDYDLIVQYGEKSAIGKMLKNVTKPHKVRRVSENKSLKYTVIFENEKDKLESILKINWEVT